MTPPLVHRTVLVVEDDDDVLGLIADVLRDRGHTVYCAHDGAGALARLRDVAFELILLDLTLPDMSGVEFLEQRDRIPQVAHIPVVIVSGDDDANAFVDGSKLPVLRKPFGATELVSAVESRD
jgi:DNA-binding response OmpR family regulator